MRDFNIGSSTIYDIKSKRELKKFTAQGETTKNTESRCTLKKPYCEILDSILFCGFVAKRSQEIPVIDPMII